MSELDMPNQSPMHLLSDEDFAELMQAEFEKSGKPQDELGQAKVWRQLDAVVSTKPAPRWSQYLSVAAAVLLVVAIGPLIMNGNQDVERMKGTDAGGDLTLNAFVLDASGGLQSVAGPRKAGDTLVFKIKSNQTLYTALVIARNNGQPEVRFSGSIVSPGADNLVQRKGKAYGYMVEPLDRQLRICGVGAPKEELLRKRLRLIVDEFAVLPDNACVVINDIATVE